MVRQTQAANILVQKQRLVECRHTDPDVVYAASHERS